MFHVVLSETRMPVQCFIKLVDSLKGFVVLAFQNGLPPSKDTLKPLAASIKTTSNFFPRFDEIMSLWLWSRNNIVSYISGVKKTKLFVTILPLVALALCMPSTTNVSTSTICFSKFSTLEFGNFCLLDSTPEAPFPSENKTITHLHLKEKEHLCCYNL